MTWPRSSARRRCAGSSPVPRRGSRIPNFGDAYCSPECARWKGAATWRSPEMRITHVVARAFGPFHGERLDVAPGMTVVTGPNESGKSSWHAALRLALTGLRRGRGRATAADAALSAQHRPRAAPDDWDGEARPVLDDGRASELRQAT